MTMRVAVGPRSPFSYNSEEYFHGIDGLRLAPVLPSATIDLGHDVYRLVLRLAPVLPSATIDVGSPNLEVSTIAASRVGEKRLIGFENCARSPTFWKSDGVVKYFSAVLRL